MQHRELPEGWDKNLPTFPADAKGIATRESSGKVLNALAQNVPWLIGGSADLAASNKTTLKFEERSATFRPATTADAISTSAFANTPWAAALNGMVLSKSAPSAERSSTSVDYMKPAIRLAALMEIPVIYVFTHDSIGLGEDGPTHQPIEQLAHLRAMPI